MNNAASTNPGAAARPANFWHRGPATSPAVGETELLERFLPTVRNVVDRLALNLPAHVDADDLRRLGLTGLPAALRKSTTMKPFSTVSSLPLPLRRSLGTTLRQPASLFL